MESKEIVGCDVGLKELLQPGMKTRDLEAEISSESEKEEGEIADSDVVDQNMAISDPGPSMEGLLEAMKNLERRMDMLELTLAAAEGARGAAKGRIITSAEMESMIKNSVCLGPNYGVGKAFIRTHLIRELGVPDSNHYSKRLNQAIKNLLARNELVFDEHFQLYKRV